MLRNCSEIAAGKWNKTALKLLWNCSKTALNLLRNCSEIATGNCSKTALKLLRNCSEIATGKWNKTALKTALKLLWNCSEIAVKLLQYCPIRDGARLMWSLLHRSLTNEFGYWDRPLIRIKPISCDHIKRTREMDRFTSAVACLSRPHWPQSYVHRRLRLLISLSLLPSNCSETAPKLLWKTSETVL